MLIGKDNAKTGNSRQAAGVLLVVAMMIGVAVVKSSDFSMTPVSAAKAQGQNTTAQP